MEWHQYLENVNNLQDLDQLITAQIEEYQRQSKSFRFKSGLTEISSAVVGLACLAASGFTAGLSLVPGMLAFTTFGYAVYLDGHETGSPTIMELAASISDFEGKDCPINQVANFLTTTEAVEYRLLTTHKEPIIQHLLNFAGQERVTAYKRLLFNFGHNRSLGLIESTVELYPTVIQQTRQPVEPPKIEPAYAVERLNPEPVATMVRPVETQLQHHPTVIQATEFYDEPTTQAVAKVAKSSWVAPTVIELSTANKPRDLDFKTVAEFLEACEQDGFPIRKLIHHPVVWLVAASQSGKSTFAALLQALRYLSGYPIIWASADVADSKEMRPLDWQSTHYGVDQLALLVTKLERKIRTASKDEMKLSTMLDELNFGVGQGVEIQDLLEMTLFKGNKVKYRCIAGVHADTLEALGCKGIKDLLVTSRALVTLGRVPDPSKGGGEYKPSGKMIVTIEGETETWTMPAWLGADPVGFLIKCFPQLQAHNLMPAPKLEVVNGTEEFEDDEDMSDLNEAEQALIQFAKKRADWIKARDIQASRQPALKGFTSEDVRNLFSKLADIGWGEIRNEGSLLQFKYIA
jgi:hypothetical protein